MHCGLEKSRRLTCIKWLKKNWKCNKRKKTNINSWVFLFKVHLVVGRWWHIGLNRCNDLLSFTLKLQIHDINYLKLKAKTNNKMKWTRSTRSKPHDTIIAYPDYYWKYLHTSMELVLFSKTTSNLDHTYILRLNESANKVRWVYMV